jgi:hypothetical protein
MIPPVLRRPWPSPQLDDRKRESSAILAAPSRGEKAISADIALAEAINSQIESVICKLRASNAASRSSIAMSSLMAE